MQVDVVLALRSHHLSDRVFEIQLAIVFTKDAHEAIDEVLFVGGEFFILWVLQAINMDSDVGIPIAEVHIAIR